MWGWYHQMWEKKKKGITKCDKRTITCNVGTAQYDDKIIKCEKRKKKPQNVTKVMSNVILELYNVRMKSLNVRKKYKRTTKCDNKYCQICVGTA